MKAVMVLVLCGVALAMARPQELAQYDVGAGDGAVHVVDGPVSDVNVVNGPANGGRPAIIPDQFFYQPPRPYNNYPGANNGGLSGVVNPDPDFYYPSGPINQGNQIGGYPAGGVIVDPSFYQPPRPYYPGGQVGDQDGHPGARSARQVDQGYYQGGQSSNPNIDISPAYVQYPNNYPGHLRPGQGHPGARSG